MKFALASPVPSLRGSGQALAHRREDLCILGKMADKTSESPVTLCRWPFRAWATNQKQRLRAVLVPWGLLLCHCGVDCCGYRCRAKKTLIDSLTLGGADGTDYNSATSGSCRFPKVFPCILTISILFSRLARAPAKQDPGHSDRQTGRHSPCAAQTQPTAQTLPMAARTATRMAYVLPALSPGSLIVLLSTQPLHSPSTLMSQNKTKNPNILQLQGAKFRSNPYQPVGDFLSNVGSFKIIESTLRGPYSAPMAS